MSERKKIPSALPDIIKSEFGHGYPANMVKETYIRSDQGLKGFCRRFGISEKALRQYIDRGNWDEAKEQYRERMYRTFSKDRREIIEKRQDAIHRIETFDLLAIEGVLDDLEKHYTENGDMFLKDSGGEILRDPYGNPMVRSVPAFVKRTLKANEELRELNTQFLIRANSQDSEMLPAGEAPKQIEATVIDLEGYELFDQETEK